MNNYNLYIFIFSIIYCFVSGNDIQNKYSSDVEKIIQSLDNDSLAYNRLSYLCDTFGPRISGSKNLEKAIDWIIKEMKSDGLSNVRGERVKVPTWIRGDESLTILVPFEKKLNMLGIGGSIATAKGGIRGEVIVVDSFDSLHKIRDKVKEKLCCIMFLLLLTENRFNIDMMDQIMLPNMEQ